MNFSSFKAVKTANTRENSHLVHPGQAFSFKYKKAYAKTKEKGEVITSEFTVSNKLFASLGLDGKDTGAMEIISPEGQSYLALVGNDDAVYFKTTKKNEGGVKGKKFKSTLLEKSLTEQGVLVDKIGVTQKLDLVLVPGSETAVIGEGEGAITTKGVYEIVKAADAELTEEEKADDAKSEALAEKEEEETAPVGTSPVSNSAASSEDDF